MKGITVFLVLTFAALSVYPQERALRNIPDIPGFKTLTGDFHMHTVFSDGLVWPTVRVDEAWEEGIDVIAITDHLEYLPHQEDIHADHDRSWQIANNYAKGKEVIIIAGTEITKSMPPGHFNALFVKDADSIKNDDYRKAIAEAVSQGAFIIWNHPGWKAQQPDSMLWWEEHSELLEKGWMHGIEVANHSESYPGAIDWARDSGLTFIASSDVHQCINLTFDLENSHRPTTLIFATEHSPGGVREALFNRRTLAWYQKTLMGKEELLKAFFIASVRLVSYSEGAKYAFQNPTEIPFELVLENRTYQDWNRVLELKPGTEVFFHLPYETGIEDVFVRVKNMLTGSDEILQLNLIELLPTEK